MKYWLKIQCSLYRNKTLLKACCFQGSSTKGICVFVWARVRAILVCQQQMRVFCMDIHENFEMVNLHYNDWSPEVMKGCCM